MRRNGSSHAQELKRLLDGAEPTEGLMLQLVAQALELGDGLKSSVLL